jgi:hypothetical protein
MMTTRRTMFRGAACAFGSQVLSPCALAAEARRAYHERGIVPAPVPTEGGERNSLQDSTTPSLACHGRCYGYIVYRLPRRCLERVKPTSSAMIYLRSTSSGPLADGARRIGVQSWSGVEHAMGRHRPDC